MLRGKTILGIAAASAALMSVAPAAQAEADLSAPTSICRVADVGSTRYAQACFSVDAGVVGTTVAPELRFGLCLTKTCTSTVPIEVDKSGYQGGTGTTLPKVDTRTLSVSWAGGTLGYVWLDGARTAVRVPGFCVGDPSYCGSALVIL
jgi:hypothetical protein